MNTLSLTLIVRNEEKHIPRVLEHAHVFANEIVIVDTGSEDGTKDEAKKFTDKIFDFQWCDDFSKARNFGIEKCTKDFVMWLDADDVISLGDAKKIKKILSQKIHWDVLFFPYNSQIDENENVGFTRMTPRIFRNDGRFFFKYPVYEHLQVPTENCAVQINDKLQVRHKNIHRWQPSSKRNLLILEKMIKSEEYGNSTLTWHYYARCCTEPKESIFYYKKLIEDKRIDMEKKSEYCINIAQKFIEIKEEENALHFLGQSISFFPLWREPFFELGKVYWRQKRYKESLQMFLLCKKITHDPKKKLSEPLVYKDHYYYEWLSLAYSGNKKYKKALWCARKCLSLFPDNEKYKNLEKSYLEKINTPQFLHEGGFSYLGAKVQKNPKVFSVFKNFFQQNKDIDLVIEIGTGYGGLSMFLKDQCDTIGAQFITYELKKERKDTLNKNPEFARRNIDIRIEDVFAEETQKKIEEIIKKKKRVLIACDGGDKIKEFSLFSKFLKKGDIIMAHDYAPNKEIFEKEYRNKIWNWREISDEDIKDAVVSSQLEDYHADFWKVAWVCKIKKEEIR